mgnify:FL=1
MNRVVISFGEFLSTAVEFADRLDALNVPNDAASEIPVIFEMDEDGNGKVSMPIPLRYSRGGRRVQ